MEDAVVRGAITDDADADLPLAQALCGERRAGGNGAAATHDGVRAQVTKVEIGDVHAAAATATVAVFLAEQLRHGLIEVGLQGAL